MRKLAFTILFICIATTGLIAQKNKGNGDKKESGIFYTDIPNEAYNILLGRPTNHSITVSILSNTITAAYIRYGLQANKLNNKTNTITFTNGQVQSIEIDKLEANKKYYYQLVYNISGTDEFTTSALLYFQTQRSQNSSFTFTIQADSHLDENTSTAMYHKTLENMITDSADFLIDLGDTWMTDKYRNDFKESLKQYIAQRYYFGTVCNRSALFLTLGNHDGESGQQLKKKNNTNMTSWATATRNNYYPNPYPNDFYSGNKEPENKQLAPKDFYSWEWANALFIVLDPFRFTNGNDMWGRSLGNQQYSWLKTTLQKSKADFKFVFIHNLVGGVDLKGKARGGSEAAKYYEWGGLDSTGANTFSQQRPGWEKPIHDLLLQHKVNIVFHGHDHFFAKQDLDGMIYQLVPQPGAMRYNNINSAAEYGYKNGKILNGPGYMRVKLEVNKATIDFVQTSIDENHKNKEVVYSYTVSKR